MLETRRSISANCSLLNLNGDFSHLELLTKSILQFNVEPYNQSQYE
jgi:hypothetical protein